MRRTLPIERFYKLAIALPIGLPALLMPAWFGMEGPEPFAAWVGQFAYLSFWTILVGGLPYAFFAICILWRFWRKPADAYRRFSYVAPLAFAPFLSACLFVFSLSAGPFNPVEKLTLSVTFGALAIPVGYFYVLLAHVLRRVATRTGFISEVEDVRTAA